MIIAVDFDGTIVEHEYPAVGKPVPHAIEIMKEWQRAGHKLILWTVRNNEELKDAVDYCASHDIFFWGINENPTQKYWASGPKCFAQVYVDDAALGCPLIFPEDGRRPYVDWVQVDSDIGDIIRRV